MINTHRDSELRTMILHGAAHLFFENKCAEIEAHFDSKFKQMELQFERQLHVYGNEIKKMRHEMKIMREELNNVKAEEEDISVIGMDKITKLDREVKHEVHDIKKIKNEVKHLKAEIKQVEQLEDELETIGRDQINNLNKAFEKEVQDLKLGMEDIRNEIKISKERKDLSVETSNSVSQVPCYSLYISKKQMEKIIDIRKLIDEDSEAENVGEVLLKMDSMENKINDDTLAVLVFKPNTDTEQNNKEDKASKATLEKHNNAINLTQPNKSEKEHVTIATEPGITKTDTEVEQIFNC